MMKFIFKTERNIIIKSKVDGTKNYNGYKRFFLFMYRKTLSSTNKNEIIYSFV